MIIWYPNHPTLVYWGLRGWWCWIMFGIIGKYIQKRFRRKIKCCEANVLNSNILISESMIPKHEALLHRASDLDSIFSLNDLSLKISSWFFWLWKICLNTIVELGASFLHFIFVAFWSSKCHYFWENLRNTTYYQLSNISLSGTIKWQIPLLNSINGPQIFLTQFWRLCSSICHLPDT